MAPDRGCYLSQMSYGSSGQHYKAWKRGAVQNLLVKCLSGNMRAAGEGASAPVIACTCAHSKPITAAPGSPHWAILATKIASSWGTPQSLVICFVGPAAAARGH